METLEQHDKEIVKTVLAEQQAALDSLVEIKVREILERVQLVVSDE